MSDLNFSVVTQRVNVVMDNVACMSSKLEQLKEDVADANEVHTLASMQDMLEDSLKAVKRMRNEKGGKEMTSDKKLIAEAMESANQSGNHKEVIQRLVERVEELQPEPKSTVWEPKKGEDYWVVGRAALVTRFTRGLLGDSSCYLLSLIAHHNVYKTEELARKASVLQRTSNLIIQACLNFDPDFEPDWSDLNQVKYCFGYNHFHARWDADYTYCFDSFGAYVSTKEKADQVLEYLNSQEIK
tara:strand:- start:615 stop:1340 length:726 start_codon:yes stop_codon:yes gene_type:complete